MAVVHTRMGRGCPDGHKVYCIENTRVRLIGVKGWYANIFTNERYKTAHGRELVSSFRSSLSPTLRIPSTHSSPQSPTTRKHYLHVDNPTLHRTHHNSFSSLQPEQQEASRLRTDEEVGYPRYPLVLSRNLSQEITRVTATSLPGHQSVIPAAPAPPTRGYSNVSVIYLSLVSYSDIGWPGRAGMCSLGCMGWRNEWVGSRTEGSNFPGGEIWPSSEL